MRQSYERIGKRMLIAQQRYAHSKQFKRAARTLRKLRTWLGCVERDISRKINSSIDLPQSDESYVAGLMSSPLLDI